MQMDLIDNRRIWIYQIIGDKFTYKLSKTTLTYLYLCKYYIGDESSKISIQNLRLMHQNSLHYKV